MTGKLEQHRVAIIGCGAIGRVHVERLQADGRSTVVALVDSHRESAERLRAALAPQAAVFREIEGIPAAARPSLAIVATPNALHFEHVEACRRCGLDLLCEKPMADTRARIDSMVRGTSEAPGRRLSVAYQRRSASPFRTLRREVLSGRWGSVRAVAAHVAENWQQTIAGTWRDDPALNWGGYIGDAGSHKVDAAFYVTGLKPVEVFARTNGCGSAVEIVANASALLEGDVPFAIDFVGNAARMTDDLHVHLSGADLMIRDGTLFIARHGQFEPFTDLVAGSNPDSAFLDYIEGASENVTPECALPVYDFTHALLESSRTGRSIRIDELQ